MNFFDASIYYTRLRTHFRFVYLHCFKHVTFRRFLIGLLYSIVIISVTIINVCTRLLDEILFPNFKHIKVKQPVFIISNPRSGTTFLHRLMCLDEEKFVYNLLYHTTFPSIVFPFLYNCTLQSFLPEHQTPKTSGMAWALLLNAINKTTSVKRKDFMMFQI